MLIIIAIAVVAGAVIGGLGRLVLPGRQNIGWGLTIGVGIVAALLGTGVAAIFGVANTPGIDWIQHVLQVGFAAAGIALVANMKGGNRNKA